MSLSLSLLYLIGILIGYFIIYTRTQTLSISRLRENGLQNLRPLRKLLEYIPQHRGMANALLQGDNSFKDKLNTLAQKINVEIKNISELVGKNDKLNIEDKVKKTEQQWNFIYQNLSQRQASDSFELHTELVKNILFLIHDIAETSRILKSQDITYTKLANVALRKLPLVTEMLGQARGMGTGVAARGQCDANMRVKLTYLLNTTRQITYEANEDIDSVINNKVLKQQNDKQATEYFLNSLENNIINTDTIGLSSTDYYDAGTDAIQHTFELLDNIIQHMQTNLQNHIVILSRKIFILRITVMGITIVISYFYFF